MINLDAVIREADLSRERITALNGLDVGTNIGPMINRLGTELNTQAQLIKALAQAIQEAQR